MEQLVILILIGLISLINWIVQKSGEARARRKLMKEDPGGEAFSATEESDPVEFRKEPDESREGEPMRRLMEALGFELPEVEIEPTAPPRPRLEEHDPPGAPPQLPSLVEAADRFESSMPPVPIAPPRLPRRDARRSATPHRQSKVQAKKASGSRKGVGALLSSPNGLRNGILLSEILGPPKALRKEAPGSVRSDL